MTKDIDEDFRLSAEFEKFTLSEGDKMIDELIEIIEAHGGVPKEIIFDIEGYTGNEERTEKEKE